MELPSSRTVLITIAVILILVVIILIVSIICSEKKKPFRNKLVKFGGQFRQVSGLNIGHPLNAPIFHARPWFGKEFNSGLREYIGAVTLPEGQSIYAKFPKTEGSYEVSIIEYPSWELVGTVLYNPELITVGYSSNDNVVLSHLNDTVLFLVTGIGLGSNIEVNSWLDKVHIYLDNPPSFKIALQNNPPIVNDYSSLSEIEEFDTSFINIWLGLNPEYAIIKKVIAMRTDTFPPSLGITNNIVYIPENQNETLIVIYPNRINTTGKEAAIYAEIKNQRTYLKQDINIAAGAFIYNADTLDTIYVEEKILVDCNSRLLPVVMYVLNIP